MPTPEETLAAEPSWGAALFLFGTLVLGWPLARRWVAHAAVTPATRPRALWDWRGVTLVCVAALLAMVLFAGRPEDGILEILVRTALVGGAVTVVAGAVIRRSGESPLRGLGLAPRGALGGVAAGLGACLLLEPAFWGWMSLWMLTAPRVGIDVGMQDVLRDILAISGRELALAGVFTVVLVPLLEELVFRGFLQPWISRGLGAAGGIVVTSLGFGLMHGVSASVPIFGLSLLLGWLRLRTGRIYASWAAHALHNGLTLWLAVSF